MGGSTRSARAVLEVGADVAHRLGHRADPRLPGRVPAGDARRAAQVRAPARDHRAVPHELPAARARVARHPQPAGRRQHVPAGHAGSHGPAHLVAVQQHSSRSTSSSATSGCRSSRCRSSSRSRGSTTTCSRPASRPRGASRWRTFWTVTFPLSMPGRGRGLHLRVHPDDRRIHHPAAGRRPEGLHVRQRDPERVHGGPRLAVRLGDGDVPGVHGRDPARDLRPVAQRAERGRHEHGGLAERARRCCGSSFWLLVVFLYAPIVVLGDLQLQRPRHRVVPLAGVHDALVRGRCSTTRSSSTR